MRRGVRDQHPQAPGHNYGTPIRRRLGVHHRPRAPGCDGRLRAADGNAAAALFVFDSVSDVALRETTDPELIVAEYRVHGHLVSSGKPFSLTYITVNRVQDGLIVCSRDYGNPLETAALIEEMGTGAAREAEEAGAED